MKNGTLKSAKFEKKIMVSFLSAELSCFFSLPPRTLVITLRT